jgi:type VI secretion system protein ImpK
MANDDPFFNPTADGPTIIRPMPGGRVNPPNPPFSKGGLPEDPFSKGGLPEDPFSKESSSISPLWQRGGGGDFSKESSSISPLLQRGGGGDFSKGFTSPLENAPNLLRNSPDATVAPGFGTPFPQRPAAYFADTPAALPALATGRARNPLLNCANGILTVAAQVRGTASHPDPDGLREGLTRQMRDFETCARTRGLAETEVLPARYMLCALVDEAVLDTPWGTQSVWSNHGLLISFHNETWGGEKFFTALERLLMQPAANLNLLELMYFCLALGFEGRYRVRDGGRDQLAQVRGQLFQSLRTLRGEPEPELSPHWRGSGLAQQHLHSALPLWVTATLATVLLLALFTGFSFTLNSASDPVYLALSRLEQRLPGMTTDRVDSAPAAAFAPSGSVTLRGLLAAEIAADRLDVVERPQGQTVIIRGDDLFASGSVAVKPDYFALLQKIGAALAQLPGAVLVTGHTDSVPIQTLRFPSNWHLSRERAQRVSDVLAETVGAPARFNAEGRADSAPLVPDDPKNARNRRVEVMLLTAAEAKR